MYSTTVFPVGTKLNLSHGSDGNQFFALQMTSMKCKDCKLDPVIGIEEHTEFTEDWPNDSYDDNDDYTLCWLLTLLNNTCPIKLSSLFVSSVMSCLFYLRLRLRWTFYEFGESSPQLLCIALKVHYRLRLRLWVVSPGHYWLWLPRIYHGEVTQSDSNHERSTASWGTADTIMAYDASCNHSVLVVLTLAYLRLWLMSWPYQVLSERNTECYTEWVNARAYQTCTIGALSLLAST